MRASPRLRRHGDGALPAASRRHERGGRSRAQVPRIAVGWRGSRPAAGPGPRDRPGTEKDADERRVGQSGSRAAGGRRQVGCQESHEDLRDREVRATAAEDRRTEVCSHVRASTRAGGRAGRRCPCSHRRAGRGWSASDQGHHRHDQPGRRSRGRGRVDQHPPGRHRRRFRRGHHGLDGRHRQGPGRRHRRSDGRRGHRSRRTRVGGARRHRLRRRPAKYR